MISISYCLYLPPHWIQVEEAVNSNFTNDWRLSSIWPSDSLWLAHGSVSQLIACSLRAGLEQIPQNLVTPGACIAKSETEQRADSS